MNKTFSIFAILLLCTVYEGIAQTQSARLVSVTGTADIKVQPDQATISIGVQARLSTADESRQQTDSKASSIINYLKSHGIADYDIQTSYLSVQPYYPYSDTGMAPTPSYYIAQKTMTFVLRKLSDYDTLMSGLNSIGVNSVDGINFGVTNIDIYKLEAKRQAVLNAKKIASTLTGELGAQLGKVYSISDASYSGGSTSYFAKSAFVADAAEGLSSGPSIAGGQVTISANVAVSFYIE